MKPLYDYKPGDKVYFKSRPELGEGVVQNLHPQNSPPDSDFSFFMAFVVWEHGGKFEYFSSLRPSQLPKNCQAKRSGQLAR